tara:strand:+ start:216 stop:683 length:468 start_codon:yes stop_codon:yes gene_type:complete
MGFDISGLNPNHPTVISDMDMPDHSDEDGMAAYFKYVDETPGIYFRNNVWWWRPLWMFICENCDDILTKKDMESGHYNDFHEISKTKANKLANKLDKLINDGTAKEFQEDWENQIEEAKKSDDEETKFWSNYPFSVDNVSRFAEFVRYSGGFTIG